MSETSTVPERVKAQSQEADRLLDSLNADPEPEQPAGNEEDSQAQPEEPTSDPGGNDDNTSAPEPAAEGNHDWKERFRKYKAATDRTVHDLRTEVATLKSQLEEAQQASESSSPNQPASSNEAVERLREDFGDDLADGVLQLVQGATAPMQEQMQHYRQSRKVEAENAFWGGLEAQVPNWKQINADPRFHQWLSQPDQTSGQIRQHLLVDAQQSFDHGRVATLFQQFLDSQQQAQGQQEQIDRRVMPDNVPASSAPASQNDRTWTRAQISQFYKDKATGRFAGREDEARALEDDLMRAQAEGRIIG